MEDMKIKKAAKLIADRLFTNGREKAERLVLELPDKRNGGGWCRAAVDDQIEEILRSLAR